MYLLSVIIPVYNAAPWLAACVDSILTSLANRSSVEIILINDGSTDGSGTLCDKYAEQHADIMSIHKPNGGVASARNVGLEHASGRYIAWVDPDDFVSGDWFPSISAAAQNDPDVIVMDTLRFDSESEKPEIYGRPGGFVDRDLFAADVFRDIRMLSGLPNKVMKAELFSGVRFDTSLPILEDFSAMPGILRRAKTVYYIPKLLYHYRQHEGSLLHHVTAERAFRSFEIALHRAREVEKKFQRAAATAAALQALAFCRNQHVYGDFGAEKEQLRICKSYVRKKLPAVCVDPEVPSLWKIKLILLALGISRPMKIRSKQHTKER